MNAQSHPSAIPETVTEFYRYWGSAEAKIALDKLKNALGIVKAGRAYGNAAERLACDRLYKLTYPEVLDLLPVIQLPSRPGRPPGAGEFVEEDKKLLEEGMIRVANGEDPDRVVADLAPRARTNGRAGAGAARLRRKWRMIYPAK
jgi:hypothetical protein